MTETISHGQYGIRTRMKPEDRTSQYVAENVQRLWQRDSNKEDEHMKFYYNGQLVRTSRNHEYTHACINTDINELKGCSATRQGAEKVKNDEIARMKKCIINLKSRLKALEEGKDRYWYKDGRTGCYEAIRKDSPYHTIESTKKSLQNCLDRIEYVEKNWQIVELEAREK